MGRVSKSKATYKNQERTSNGLFGRKICKIDAGITELNENLNEYVPLNSNDTEMESDQLNNEIDCWG